MKKIIKTRYSIAAAVAFLTFLVYLFSLRNNFIGWDDGTYVIENPYIRSLNGSLLKWAFFDFYASNWHPLTWISHALDYAVWGSDPLGHHLTNNILHAVNTFFVVLLVVKLIEAASSRGGFQTRPYNIIAAGVTGLLFGLHPVHVESVAWVSERKDLLCALFFLLSVKEYMSYMTYKTYKAYFLSLLFFTLALMSKPMAVSLPAVLLVLDWYPFEKIRSLKTFLNAVINKAPFIALSIGSSVLTMLAQEKAMGLMDIVVWQARVLVGVHSLFAYLGKMLLPMDLSPFYPYSGNVYLLSPQYFLPLIVLIGLTITLIIIARRDKLWPALWCYYAVTLIPVLGFVQVGRQSMADRYTYLPSIAPFLVTGLLVAWAYRKSEKPGLGIKLAFASPVLCVVLCLAYLTFKQIGIWNNSIDFWSYVIQKEPDISFVYYNRALSFYEKGQFDKAVTDFDKAIALNPTASETYNNRGIVFEKMGDPDKAIADYDKAIALNPANDQAYYNRGIVYETMGDFDKAIANYDKAIALNPANDQGYNNRGVVFEKMGQFDKAIADYEKVVGFHPTNSQAYNNRGVVFEKMGRFDKAIADYSKAIGLNSSNPDIYFNRGNAYDAMGEFDKAIADYDKTITMHPSDSQALNNRGLVFEKMGEFDKAIADYDKAVALDPSNTDADHNRRAALENKIKQLNKTGTTSRGVE